MATTYKKIVESALKLKEKDRAELAKYKQFASHLSYELVAITTCPWGKLYCFSYNQLINN